MNALLQLEPARWPSGPKHCPVANLGYFASLKELKAFTASLNSNVQEIWKCKACGGWHFWAKPPAPAGASSGTARYHPVPKRILKLIEETKQETPFS